MTADRQPGDPGIGEAAMTSPNYSSYLAAEKKNLLSSRFLLLGSFFSTPLKTHATNKHDNNKYFAHAHNTS